MKRVKITKAKFVSLFGNPGNNNFYQDGDFFVTNDKMNKARWLFYPYYQSRYNGNKDKIIHQIAFAKTIKMIDNGEKLPEFDDYKIYHSIGNIPFSKKQVEYVEKKIKPQFKNMSLEELYDYMLIEQERNNYETNRDCKKAVADLIDKGFFDKYLNGQLKPLALWSIGRLDDINDMLVWLYSKNRFTGKLNVETLEKEMKKTRDEVVDSDDRFMKNPIYLAFDYIQTSIWKLNRIPK
jgi:hypothetical protein